MRPPLRKLPHASLLLLLIAFLHGSSARAQKPELVIQQDHANQVFAVAFSPDGRYLATGTSARAVQLWNLKGGGDVQTLAAPDDGQVFAVAFSPDGRYLA